MKKVTVVRQNRCDKEMKLLLFGCFFFLFAMQLFVGVTDRPQLVNAINMALYLCLMPGLLSDGVSVSNDSTASK